MGVLRAKLDEGQGEAGLAWLEGFLEGFDTSKLSRLTLDHGKTGRAGVWGVCRYPEKGVRKGARSTYRISCHVGRDWPYGITTRKPPLYQNPQRTSWVRRYSVTTVHDADEAIVWIAAHELAHFLRRTKQISGRNDEIRADEFADARLAEFRGRP